MNRHFLSGAFAVSCLVIFTSCQTHDNDRVSVGGVPGWLASGARIDEEPPPYRPDPAIIKENSPAGPLEWTIITDQREYRPAPVKKVTPKHLENDPLERGRAQRLLRLTR